MEQQLLAIYYIPNYKVEVYGCSDEETPDGEFDFYDLYLIDEQGSHHLNEGEPFHEWPTWFEARMLLGEFYRRED